MCARPAATGFRTSHCRALAAFCQPPLFWGSLVMETTIPCQLPPIRRLRVPITAPRGPATPVAGTAAGTSTGGLTPAARRRRNSGGRSLNTRPLGREPPRGGPKTALMGRGGPAPVAVHHAASGRGKGGRMCRPTWPLPLTLAAWYAVRGGAPNRFGVARKTIWPPAPRRDCRADPRKAGAGARRRRVGGQIV